MAETPSRPGRAAARLEAAGAALLAEVATLPAGLVHWKPAPDVWSVMEILCHVGEFVPYWTSQTLQIARQPDLEWGRTHTDTARLDAVGRAGSRSLDDVVDEIRQGVSDSAQALRELGDAEWDTDAISRNPRWGRQPASFVVEHLLIEHVEKHLGQVRRNVGQYAERGVTD